MGITGPNSSQFKQKRNSLAGYQVPHRTDGKTRESSSENRQEPRELKDLELLLRSHHWKSVVKDVWFKDAAIV